MPRVCTVCSHTDRSKINAAIVKGESNRSIAKRFSLNTSSVQRHTVHVAEKLEKHEVLDANKLVDRLASLEREAQAMLAQAKRSKDGKLTMAAIRELREQIRLAGEFLGKITNGPTVNVALVQSGEWVAMRSAILRALTPHPEARSAVIAALSTPTIIDHPTEPAP